MGLMISSGLVTTTSEILSGTGNLHSIDIIADGTNQAIAAVTDGSGGTALAKGSIKAASNPESIHIDCKGVQFHTGLYVTLTGTGAAIIARYEKVT